MYEYIKGNIDELTPTSTIVEASGIGYMVNITLNSYSQLEGKSECKLYIEEIIREDSHTLYGFTEKEERSLFRQLLTVSGIGANTANMILSAFTVGELEQIISDGDCEPIKKVKGIGLKTAQRLIVDLKDKIKVSGVSAGPIAGRNADRQDAINALVMLGYQQADSTKLVDSILKDQPTLTLDKIVKEALKMNMKR